MLLKGKEQSPLHNIQQVLSIIYQVAGGTGAGVFNEAKVNQWNKKRKRKSLGYWGVDRDQEVKENLNLKMVKNLTSFFASTLKKRIGGTVKDIAT